MEFPAAGGAPPDDARLATLHRVLDLLAVVGGYQLLQDRRAGRITSGPIRLHPAAAAFVRDLYTQGLGEFAYRNDLPHVLESAPRTWPSTPARPAPSRRLRSTGRECRARPLVTVGGGKDSVVSVEALRAAGLDPVLFRGQPEPS